MQRECDSCGVTYEHQRAASRYCSHRCRTRAARGAVRPLPGRPASSAPGAVAAAVTAELQAADRLGSPRGQAALVLARRLDDGGDTGAGVAAVAKQLQVTLAAAVADVQTVDDPLDELRARRSRKRRDARGQL